MVIGNPFNIEGAPLDHLPQSHESLPFWKSLSLDELAKLQGVEPVSNLDEISNLWPADDDPDELMHFVVAERHERTHAS